MSKLSRKQRQSQPEIRPDYSKIHFESVKADDRDYWQERAEKNPLLRYRTHHTATDVVNLIKTTDPEGLDASPNIYFDHLPTPLEEEGRCYNFYIEYRSPQKSFWSENIESKKLGHVEGAVISDTAGTILEFRSTQTTADRLLESVGDFLVWVLLLAFIFCFVSWFVALLISDGDTKTTIFVLTVFMLITTLWFASNESKRVGKGMKSVIKQLSAVKIKDEMPMHET